MLLQTIYICATALIEIIAYSVLVGLSVEITKEKYGAVSSISEAMSLSVGVASYYTSIVYMFTIGRNVYEFYIDPCERLNAWKYNTGLYVAIWFRIIFLNMLMLFLFLTGSVSNTRDPIVHGQFAICAVAFHLLLELTCICIRSYYAITNNLLKIKCISLYVFLLVTEVLLSISAILFGLCFTSVISECEKDTDIVYVSEYMLFAIVVFTPAYRLLD